MLNEQHRQRLPSLLIYAGLLLTLLIDEAASQTVSNCKDQGPIVAGNPTCNTCLDGYYKNPLATACLQCGVNCLTCNDGSTCASCIPGTNMTFTQQCVGCGENCTSCNGNTCSSCASTFSLVGNQCVKCILGCVRCTDSSSCEECSGHYRKTSSSGGQICTFNMTTSPVKLIVYLIAAILVLLLCCGCGYCLYRFPPATVKEIQAIKLEKRRRMLAGIPAEDLDDSLPDDESRKEYVHMAEVPVAGTTAYAAMGAPVRPAPAPQVAPPAYYTQAGAGYQGRPMFQRPPLTMNSPPQTQQQFVSRYGQGQTHPALQQLAFAPPQSQQIVVNQGPPATAAQTYVLQQPVQQPLPQRQPQAIVQQYVVYPGQPANRTATFTTPTVSAVNNSFGISNPVFHRPGPI